MSRARGILLAAAVLAAALATTVVLPALRGRGGSQPAGDVPVYVVERADFERTVHAEGNMKAAEATLLGPPAEAPGPLKIAWLYGDGTPVAAGEVVIRFDPTEMERDLEDGRHDRSAADSRITQRSVQDEGAMRNLERDARMADLELDYSRSFQSKDPEVFSRADIIRSEIDQDLADRRRDHAEKLHEIRKGVAQAELDLLGIERRKAEIKIGRAEQGLQALEVEAPHDGIFVLKQVWGRVPEVGQVVWGGNAIAEIPRLDEMEARIFVLEADAGGLEEGIEATVVLEAHPGAVYSGKVSKVDALAQPRNYRVPVQYFGVTVTLDRTDPDLMKPGQRVRAVLTLDRMEDVLSVPRQSVFEVDGKNVVYVRRGSGFEPAEVQLGARALGRVVVESGVAPGERIALRDPTRPAEDPGSQEGSGAAGPVGAPG